jgi:hypothetical protein
MNAQTKRRNDKYRDEEPSRIHQYAYKMAIETGSVPEDTREELVGKLYEPFAPQELPVDPWEPTLPTDDEGNGLGIAVIRDDYGIDIRVSEKLYHQQPIGVLLRPIDDAVRKRGEALITDVCPRSADVTPEVMPAKHYSLRVEPLPCWLAKWIGSNGYDPHKPME